MWVPLHNAVLVEAAHVDPAATRAVDPPGEDSAGYDDLFKQAVPYRDSSSGDRETTVQTITVYFLAQVEMDLDRLKRMTEAGDIPAYDLGLVAHVKDLKRRGLMGTDGRPTIQIGDRVRKLLHPRRTTEVLEAFLKPVEVWIEEIRSASWGFSGRRDLFVFFCTKKTEPI